MNKHKNFIGRLLTRNGPRDSENPNTPEVDVQVTDSQEDPAAGDLKAEKKVAPGTPTGPTICRGGKLFKARLKGGNWESIGPPIGDC